MQIDYYFDPVCPFCWVTSKWVRQITPHRDLDVNWTFISLRFLNEGNYEGKPEGYEDSHRRGTDLLRIAAAIQADHGAEAVGAYYREVGERIWEVPPTEGLSRYERNGRFGDGGEIEDALTAAGLPADYAAAQGDEGWDAVIKASTALGLERTGDNVGTPIITYGAPDGPSYFGPVISDVPELDDSLRMWDAIVTLGEIWSFAELKRSLRERPRLPQLGTA